MNKNSKWLLAVGVAVTITASGIAMAAVGSAPADAGKDNRPAAFEKREGKAKAFKEDHSKLLALLKMDEQTFKAEMKAGKTLVAVAQAQGVSAQELQAFLESQMTQRLEAGLQSGRMTAEQAEKMKSAMPELVTKMMNGQGPMHHGPRAGHAPFANDKMLAFLNIDAETLRSELKAEKTLVAVAGKHGVSEQELKAFLVAQMTERLDAGVQAGRLTAEQADKMKANMDERVTKMMNGQGPMHHGPRAGHAPFANDKMLAFLNIDAETLRSELKAEKTLVAVAGKHGVSEQELKAFLVAQMTERLDAGVQAGRLTAEQADKMKANMDERVTKMINTEGLMHRGPGPLPKQAQQADS